MNRAPVIAVAALAAGMAFIDTTALTVALPALQSGLSASNDELLWIHNAYAVPLAALLLLGGALGDRFGTRRIFLAGVVGFALASTACGLAPNPATLIAFRLAQGIGAAVMIPGSLALVARGFPGGDLGRAVGLWSAFTVVATALGPILGGLLAQHGLWRGVFLINVPLAAVTVVLTALRLPPDRPAPPTRLDVPGALLLSLALAALSATLIRPSALLTTAAVLGLGLFLAWESAARRPLVPSRLFRSRPFTLATGISLLLYAAWGGFTFLLPTHLIRDFDLTPTRAGLFQLPAVILLALVSPLAGKFRDRFGPRRPLLLGTLLCAAGFGTVAGADSAARILPSLALLGLGLGFCAAPLSATILAAVPEDHRGLAAGINSTAARVATALGVALLGALAFRRDADGFDDLCALASVLAVLAALATLGFTSASPGDEMPPP